MNPADQAAQAPAEGLPETLTTLFCGVVWVAGACGFWLYLAGNPVHELTLILRAEVAPGFIVSTWEEPDAADDGRTIWRHRVHYTYRLPDGREFSQTTGDRKGRLRDDLRDLEQPVPVGVEYDPRDPQISRVKGDGHATVVRWFIFKVGLGGLLLALFVTPGVGMIRDAMRSAWRIWKSREARPS